MKKIISLLLVGLMSFGLFGCGAKEEKKDTAAKPQTNKKEDKKGIPEIKLNETFKVKTERGDYEFIIEGIRETDERNEYSEQKPKKVILLDYNYKNETFNTDLLLDSGAFQLVDDEGNVLDTYPVSDENREPKAIPVGTKSKGSQGYAIGTDTKNVTVLFKRGSEVWGKAIIKLQTK